jgi:16S rRNA (cytosine967-C5)-methyltransferase
MTNPRALALDVLVRVEAGAFLDALVGETLARCSLEPRDAALFTRLAYGTVAWQARIDWTLAALVDRDLAALDPPIRASLRLGLYQLHRLERIPAHAAVDATVGAARRWTGRGGVGLVNAVLRRAAREGERPLPPGGDDPVPRWAIEWSHPEWLVRRWVSELGAERAVRRLAADNEAAPTVLRVDVRAATRDEAVARLRAHGLDAQPATHAPNGIVLAAPLAALEEADRATALVPQGEASQLVVELLAPAPGERLLDACAAPGGKAAASAERVGAGQVMAADRSIAGVRRIRSRAGERPALLVLVADGTAPPWREAVFDGALVDAPCSGLGTLRSHPEIRWRRRAEDLAPLAALQRELLARSAACVRPGGRLVYATCTLTPEENDVVVATFLRDHSEWRRADPRARLAAHSAALIDPLGALRTAPEVDGLDGFYAVRLERSA